MRKVKKWIKGFKFGWQYANAGRFVIFKARQSNSQFTMIQWLEMRNAQMQNKSAIVAFPNGNIYTEKAHQNEMEKLRKELTKWTSK